MSDDTRLDVQVRRALTTLPAPDEHETREALVAVLERSAGTAGRRTRAWTVPVAAAAAVGVLAGAVAVGSLVGDTSDDSAPAGTADPLVGTWQRRVPDSAPESLGGRWTMTLSPEGVVRLTGPAGAPSAEGTSYSAGAHRLRLDAFANNVCAELPAATYTWRTTGNGLTLSLVQDPCPVRADLFLGTWRRVP